MKCNEIKKKIIDFIEKELSLEERKEIKEHMEKCKDCRREYIENLALFELLRNDEVEKPQRLVVPFFSSGKKKRRNFLIPMGIVFGIFLSFLTWLFLSLKESKEILRTEREDVYNAYITSITDDEIKKMEEYIERDVYEELYEIAEDEELFVEFIQKIKNNGGG